MPSGLRQQMLLIAGCILVIVTAGVWIIANLTRPAFNQKLQVGIGQVMAEETARLLKAKGRIVVVTLDPKACPPLKTQVDAFTGALKKGGRLAIVETVFLSVKEKRKAGPGMGLSDGDFIAILEKHSKPDAIVSFVGTPDPDDQKIVALGELSGVKVLAETRSRRKLK